LQPGCRITWEQVRFHVLCATSCVTAYELGKSGSLAKLLSVHLQDLISGPRNSVQRSCNLIVKGLTEELKDRLSGYGQVKLSVIGRNWGKTISAGSWLKGKISISCARVGHAAVQESKFDMALVTSLGLTTGFSASTQCRKSHLQGRLGTGRSPHL
jgi:hypothetical protein